MDANIFDTGSGFDSSNNFASDWTLNEDDMDFFSTTQNLLTDFNANVSAVPIAPMVQPVFNPAQVATPAVQQYGNGMIAVNGVLFQPVPGVQQMSQPTPPLPLPQQSYAGPSTTFGMSHGFSGASSFFGMPEEVVPAPAAQAPVAQMTTASRSTSRNKRKRHVANEASDNDSDDESVIDVTPSKRPAKAMKFIKPTRKDKRKNSLSLVIPNAAGEEPARVIIKSCTCHPMLSIKRPMNAFLIYRTRNCKAKEFAHLAHNAPAMSRAIGASWKALDHRGKQWYYEAAAREKKQHASDHPDYKYCPGVRRKAQYGDADCKCGAYQINMEATFASAGIGGLVPETDPAEEMSRPAKGKKRAAAAASPVSFLPSARSTKSVAFNEPEGTRRSTRNAGKAMNYNEDQLAFEFDTPAYQPAAAATATSSAAACLALPGSAISAVSPKTITPPRRRSSTRSSKGRRSTLGSLFADPTEANFGEFPINYDFDFDMFDAAAPAEKDENMGENIDVAMADDNSSTERALSSTTVRRRRPTAISVSSSRASSVESPRRSARLVAKT